jgi:hypothetical protein
MNWICPRCRVIVAGGRQCPDCGPEVLLLDVADPRNRAYLVGQGGNIRSVYDARLAMLRFFAGTLLGLAAGGWLVRAGFSYAGVVRWAFFAGAAAALLFGVFAFAPLSRFAQRTAGRAGLRALQRLFSRAWAKRTLRAMRRAPQ